MGKAKMSTMSLWPNVLTKRQGHNGHHGNNGHHGHNVMKCSQDDDHSNRHSRVILAMDLCKPVHTYL